ncbi:MAG: hypothetical protein KAX84_15265, partial [Burkholderiales bacterium]|nr:hypothetical protein [Burkholderiales bacterium]
MRQRAMGWRARIIAALFGAGLQLAGAQALAQAAAPLAGAAPSTGSDAPAPERAAVAGEVTRIRGAHIKGWACDAAAPTAALPVRVLDGNGSVLASAVANEPQTGLDRHEPACGSDRHGFTIDLPKGRFSCVAQALIVAAVPAAGGAPVALPGSGAQSGAVSRPPVGRITVSAQGGGANPPLTATFTPDPDGGSLARVRWLDGGTVIGDTIRAPHTIRWTPRRGGALDIHAITTDGCGVNSHVAAPYVPVAGIADARPPLVSFADPGPGRSYFTPGNLPLRVRVTRQSSPLAQLRLYYATSADDPAAPYQPLTAVAAPVAGAYLGSWALPRPAPGTPWDGRYVLLAEAEDAAGRVGAARIELPVALPTYGQAAAATIGIGDRANNNVPLSALFIVAGQGENAAPEAAGADPNSNSDVDVDRDMEVEADAERAGDGRANGGVDRKALYTVNVTVVGGGTVSASVPAGKNTSNRFTNCIGSCSTSFDTGGKGSTDLTLTATASPGSVFTGWLGAPCTGRSTCSFAVSAPAAITAIFAPAAMAPGGILPVTLDIDANLAQDALTDALLTVRYLFGLGEASIVNGALGPGAQRGGAGQPTVSGYLGAIRPVLDVDGNGVADALTDGLLINRYQFGLRGASLIAGAIGANAQRTTAAQIESYLASPCGAGIAFGAVASNAVIVPGTAVSLSANVTPTALCPVDSVQYTLVGATGKTVIGTGTTAPNFSAQWNTAGVAPGTYVLTATARYGAFPVAAASASNVRINAAPSIALLAPAIGYAYGYDAALPPAVPLRIAVADADGVPANGVTLRLNGAAQALTSLGGGQWQATTAPLAPGNYTVAVTATDSLGTATNVWFGASGPGTAPPTFTVKNTNAAPAVALNASAANANVGGSVTLTATAQDADGWVGQAAFAVVRSGAVTWTSTATNAAKANPWSPAPTASWTPAQPGTYTASVTATDNVGGTAVSAPVTIVVAQVNAPPTIVSVAPAQQQVLQGGTATITVIARDPDGDALTLQLLNGTAALAGVTVVRLDPYVPAGDNTYVLTWDTAAVAPQAYPSLVVKAADNAAAGGSATRSVAVTVIAAPASATPAADVVYPGFYATPAIGTAPGSLSISESGAATYSMPIQVAPGAAGMQPQLALNYSSQGGNGLMGPGWSLSGLSVITRCAQTEAQDGSKEGINYDGLAANDRYCLDGQRLVPVSAPAPVTDAGVQARRIEYRTELESYSQIESYQEALPNHLIGPYRFRVLTRSGQQLDYGARWWIISRGYLQTLDTQGLVNRSNTARLWALDRVSDRHGNYLTVDYDDGDGDDSGAASPVVLASFSPATSSLASLPAPFGAFPAVQHWPTRIRYYSSGVAENTAGRFNEACF